MQTEPKLKAEGALLRFKGRPYYTTFLDHVFLQVAMVPKLLVAILVWRYYDLLGAAKSPLSSEVILPILLRDLAITWATAGLWDTLLYSRFSPFKDAMRPYKFNPVYPKNSQFVHDAFWSTVSTLVSTGVEVAILRYSWAAMWTPAAAAAPWYSDWRTIAWMLTMPCK